MWEAQRWFERSTQELRVSGMHKVLGSLHSQTIFSIMINTGKWGSVYFVNHEMQNRCPVGMW